MNKLSGIFFIIFNVHMYTDKYVINKKCMLEVIVKISYI